MQFKSKNKQSKILQKSLQKLKKYNFLKNKVLKIIVPISIRNENIHK